MLCFKKCKNHAGIVLLGDYHTLRQLHDTLHEISDKSTFIEDKEGLLLALAYDVRKAYEQQREIIPPREHLPEEGVMYGTEIVWPVLLVQSRLLRQAMAHTPTTRWHHACAYNLEAVVESALRADFDSAAHKIIEEWEQLALDAASVDDQMDPRGGLFSSLSKSERKLKLASLLQSFSPGYRSLYSILTRNGADHHMVSPQEIDAYQGAAWCDPRF